MRKTFKLFCAAVVAALAVSSCYDDALVWDELDKHAGEIAGLEERIAKLEEKLNTEVATINTALGTLKAADEKLAADIAAVVADVKKVNETLTTLDAYDKTLDGKIADLNAALAAFEDEATKQLAAAIAQIAVVKAEKNEAGNYVLTFADGKTLEVAAADANANNTGVITTVEVDGVTYWAVIGADGNTTVLDAAVHPDTKLQFKVDPETNELLVAYDGKTWEKTGVIVNDETTFNVVTDFEDGEDYVTITVGEEEYQLPKYVADNSSLVLGRTDAFFAYGISKKIELQAEDIEEYYVMAKPDGWKAVIDGTTLTVTAPAEEVVNMGAGETEGEVLVHATTLTGTCKVVKLEVTAGPGLTLSYKDGNITLFTAMTETTVDPWFGDELTDFAQVMVGATTFDEYRTYDSFKSFLESRPNEYQELKDCFGNILTIASNSLDMETWYVDGEREELTLTLPLDEVAAGSWPPVELDPTKNYVVWAVPSTSEGYLFDSAVYATTGNDVEFTASNSVYNNADIALDLFGADGYYVGAANKAYLEAFFGDWGLSEDEILEYYLLNGTMGGWGAPSGPFSKFLEGKFNSMGTFVTPGQRSIKLKDVLLADQENEPDNEYYVWILPYYESQPAADYDVKDLVVKVCETAPMVKNDALKPEMTIIPAFEKVTYIITPPANGKTVHEVFAAEDFEAEYMAGDTLKEVELKNWLKWNEPVVQRDTITNTWSIEAGVDYVIATYTTVEGEYAFSVEEFTAPLYETPNHKQWLFNNDYIADCIAPTNFVLDLGVSCPNNYYEYFPDPNTLVLGLDYEEIYGEEAAGMWMSAGMMGSYTINPTDEESGVILYNSAEIPYSDYNGETCTFDLSALFMEDAGTVVVEATLSEEEIVVMIQ